MNERPLTDARISAALRAHLPAEAGPGMSARIGDVFRATPQQRPLPSFLQSSDSGGRLEGRALLIAAAFVLAVALAGIAAAGAIRQMQQHDTSPLGETVDVPPPGNLQALALSTYDRMPDLPPMSFTTITNGADKGRVLVGTRERVRIDRYASLDAPEPETYTIFTRDGIGELAMADGQPVWLRSGGPIDENPNVYVLTAVQGTANQQYEPGCEFTREEPGGPDGSAGAGWHYVGGEMVIGRPTWHITCGEADVWIDTETRLILRSEGPPPYESDVEPSPGARTVVEVRDLDFTVPDGGFFGLETPDGAEAVSPEVFQCATQPDSCATPEPEPSPPPPAVAHGTMPSRAPATVANGWIAYSTDSVLPGSTDKTTGSDLYLVREGGDPILLADRAGGGTRNMCPRFSPDGHWLAWGVTSASDRAIVVVGIGDDGVEGPQQRIDVLGTESSVCARWSSDSERIGYLDGSEVVIHHRDGSLAEGQAGDPVERDFEADRRVDDPVRSPSGDLTARLADGATGCALLVATPDGTAAEVIQVGQTSGAGHVDVAIGCPYAFAGWSPDGRKALLMQDISGIDYAMHAVTVDEPFTVTTIVPSVHTNGARSWAGYGDVSWQAVAP